MTEKFDVEIKSGERMACGVSREMAEQIIAANKATKPSGKRIKSAAAEAAETMRIVPSVSREAIEREAAVMFARLAKMDRSPSRTIMP